MAGTDLTEREREVAALVAEGLSDKEIGGRLMITNNTVRTIVHMIRVRLGFHSRVQIAVWFTEQRLRVSP